MTSTQVRNPKLPPPPKVNDPPTRIAPKRTAIPPKPTISKKPPLKNTKETSYLGEIYSSIKGSIFGDLFEGQQTPRVRPQISKPSNFEHVSKGTKDDPNAVFTKVEPNNLTRVESKTKMEVKKEVKEEMKVPKDLSEKDKSEIKRIETFVQKGIVTPLEFEQKKNQIYSKYLPGTTKKEILPDKPKRPPDRVVEKTKTTYTRTKKGITRTKKRITKTKNWREKKKKNWKTKNKNWKKTKKNWKTKIKTWRKTKDWNSKE